MSSDTDDKAQSTFPRSSLRARSRAIVMAPADAQDFRPEPRKTKTPIRLEDIFDEPFGESLDKESANTSVASALSNVVGQSAPETPADAGVSKQPEKIEYSSALESDFEDNLSELGESPSELPDPFSAAPGDPPRIQEPPRVEREVPASVAQTSVAPVAKIVRTVDSAAVGYQAPEMRRSSSGHDYAETAGASNRTQVPNIVQAHDEYSASKPVTADPEVGNGEVRRQSSTREIVESKRISKLVGFLVTYQRDRLGEYIELREGRLLVSSTGGASDNCLVINDPSVSPMHAIMRISSDGTILILDQLSEHGTRIKRRASGKEETLLGDKSTLEHEDLVTFGECAYHVCILKGV